MTAESSSSPLAPDWDAIARFLSGESSDSEAEIVHRWLDTHPADREMANELRAALKIDATASLPDVDVEAALTRVHGRMAEAAIPRLVVERGGAPRWRAAAVLGGLLAAGLVGVVVMRPRHATQIPAEAAAHTYATGVGQRDSVRLADGSRVVLGPQSRLVVPGDFGSTSRAVQLTGDAFFDVHHDAAKPFSVRSAGAVIEDIGTTFAIESDGGDGMMVSVVTGSVRLRAESSAPTAGVVLAAGDRGALNTEGVARAERDAVRADDLAWTAGRLIFSDAPLGRVISEIQRWYGVTVRVSDSALLRRTVHASFDGESADKALEILGLTLGARVERHGDTATVTPARGTGSR